ncbi:Stk1 family PASTA domain-containing Ser/Thr kinase [Prauserella halophila]|uniref:non-specific serine/threonine protein kinase n=1 Tax=Prauserella halophila TaxID=185641 RepID=A0ABP4H3D8_9PSEU|nr:Stk1 family PASTA domain-containing Ser/Thr kinase [Prauserella halophila]MCP2234796.1 serine/threonine protein kinase [Prauserella halophila]
MTRTDENLVGALLDRRYRVDGLLARGGMSSVYRGLDTRLDRPVAIKIMDSRFADDRSFVERFEREARSAAKLHHPHVVAVHDQGFDGTPGSEQRRAFLVMELVDGGTLRDLLEGRGALTLPQVLTVAEDVLSALGAAHAAGLVHRDVKPENVLIGRGGQAGSGVVKVGDFGLVRAVAATANTTGSVILGTVAYLSPEQVTDGSASERGDVYSAGILLYEMLTGHVPYTADTPISVAYRHVNDDVPAPSAARSDLPPALDDLVLRATRRDADARPADATAFLEQLRAIRGELGIQRTAVPIPAPQHPPQQPAQSPAPQLPPPEQAGSPEASPPESDAERTVPVMQAVTAPTSDGPTGTQALPRSAATASGAASEPPGDGPPRDEPAAPRRRGGWLALWLVAALLLVGGVGAGGWWLLSGRYVDVPDISGLDRQQAAQALRNVDLTPTFEQERHNTVPSGTGIRTDPPAGAQAEQGDRVTVMLSLGKPVVPDIQPGTSVEQAQQAIERARLTPTRDENADQYSTDVEQGAVLSVSPQPGTQANIGTNVAIVVSKGPEPLPVPSVVGRSRDEAFTTLQNAGFEPYDAGEEFSTEVAGGHVVRTDPADGETVDEGTRIGVYVSDAVDVPDVQGRPLPDARQLLSDAGLTVAGDEGDEGDAGGLGGDRFVLVVGQSPDPGKRVEPGTEITLSTLP